MANIKCQLRFIMVTTHPYQMRLVMREELEKQTLKHLKKL